MGDVDLSNEIIRAVGHRPGEQVTCKRITQSYYRCNWWLPISKADYDNPQMRGSLVSTNRICRSQFLRAEMVKERLDIFVFHPTAGKTSRARYRNFITRGTSRRSFE
jgi:hypothetical protein